MPPERFGVDKRPGYPRLVREFVWSPGDRIHISAARTLQVVRRYHDDADDLPVLVVEDVA